MVVLDKRVRLTSASASPSMGDSDDGYEYEYGSSASDGSDVDMSDGDLGFHAEVESSQKKAKFKVFSKHDLKERQEEAVNQVTSVLGIPPGEAARVLRQYKWDAGRVNEEWWTDTDTVRDKVGLVEEQPEPSTSGKSAKVRCNICFEEVRPQSMCAAACKHYFCKDCWRGYISTAIGNGPTCLSLRCPATDCSIAVPGLIISEVARPEEKEKYDRYALRSYVEDNRKMEWCPAPDCEHAVECLVDLSGEPLDITCACGCSFCFTCKEEAHRPVDCATVKKWIVKNSAESENLNWILANTKPCPKCKRPIEKNQGCMHMTCSQCGHQFCWLCLAAWTEHGERTGGFYACNRYEAAKQKGEYDEQAQKREHAKHALERYMHYYQRWAENDKSRLVAVQKMKHTQEETLETLSNRYAKPTSQLKFITDAWAQVVDCRRILKWTYAFGYYNFDESIKSKHSAAVLKQQQQFFEFNQGQAEFYLERLHRIAEKELMELAEGELKVSQDDWGKFREKLIGLTDVTKSHFEKLVQELEKGMENMLNDYNGPQEDEEMLAAADEPIPMAEDTSKLAKDKKKEAKAKTPRTNTKRTRASQRSAGLGAAGPSDSADLLDMDSEAEEALGFWQCRACTFANQDLTADHCDVCEAPRARWVMLGHPEG